MEGKEKNMNISRRHTRIGRERTMGSRIMEGTRRGWSDRLFRERTASRGTEEDKADAI